MIFQELAFKTLDSAERDLTEKLLYGLSCLTSGWVLACVNQECSPGLFRSETGSVNTVAFSLLVDGTFGVIQRNVQPCAWDVFTRVSGAELESVGDCLRAAYILAPLCSLWDLSSQTRDCTFLERSLVSYN